MATVQPGPVLWGRLYASFVPLAPCARASSVCTPQRSPIGSNSESPSLRPPHSRADQSPRHYVAREVA
eukprot:6459842-Lingulodinium_polyedra.AAC.1